MRVLLIAYHYAPDPAVGALRSGRIARILLERGHEVRVLAGPLAGEPALAVNGSEQVERLDAWLDPRAMYARFKRQRQRGSGAVANKADNAAVDWAPPKRTPAWKRHANAMLWLPDDRQGWMAAAIRRGRALVSSFDLVYSTAPPFSALLAGLAIRRKATGARWVAEFRDPWTGNPVKPDFVRTRWSDWADRRLEQACLESAEHVVCVTESTAALLRRRLGPNGDKVELIRNGIESSGESSLPAGSGNGSILYMGNLYHSRDPRPFLQGFADLAARGSLPDGTSVDFVGACSHYRGIDVEAYAKEIGVGHLVNVRGPVPHEVCVNMMQHASVLLLLAQDQPLQVPNKLYEYLRAGRPILAFADPDGETAGMLAEVGGHTVIDGSNTGDVAASILAALETELRSDSRTQALLDEWSTAQKFTQFIEPIERSIQSGMG